MNRFTTIEKPFLQCFKVQNKKSKKKLEFSKSKSWKYVHFSKILNRKEKLFISFPKNVSKSEY